MSVVLLNRARKRVCSLGKVIERFDEITETPSCHEGEGIR